jgi:5-keto 4-deoxyuronate isomerase
MATSQLAIIKIAASGVSPKIDRINIECGNLERGGSGEYITDGTTYEIKCVGKSFSMMGAEGTVYVTIDENNRFDYYFLSAYSGDNKSKLRKYLASDSKYKVELEVDGNTGDQGALGTVLIRVTRIKR